MRGEARKALARETRGGVARNGRRDELDLAPRKENGERNGKLRGVHEDKSADAEVGRDCRRVDALAGDHGGGMGVGAQCRAQERHYLLV